MKTLLAHLLVVSLMCGAVALGGCAAPQEVIVVTAEGRRATPQAVDEDPWRLLPPGAVMWLRLDMKQAFQAEFGPQIEKTMVDLLPFATGAGIEPKKDIDVVVGALYATVGSDIVAVGQGRFDPLAVERAVQKKPESVGGLPIQVGVFAGSTMYVAGHSAMAILTESTLVFGTQLGVRRVLERVEEGRLKRTLPAWYEALLSQAAAEFQWGIDLDSQPVPAAFRTQVEFLNQLRAARLVGNFRSPGLNLAGTLTYESPQVAETASRELLELEQSLGNYDIILAALRVPKPIRSLRTQAIDKDTQVAIEIDGRAIAAFLDNASQFVGEGSPWLPN
jgi:hypothetical protein